ncbi:MAG: NMD3-related protein [Archaeoglobaceae archaeon]|nr:NMD3-related protein [Archaeoglobaceae archaeon]MDW7989195.1 NMD3-related protein [Archaeoglobaceae archaeon]
MKCIVCGRESEYRICGKCFAEKNILVSIPNIEIEVCSRCSNVKFGKDWIRIDLEEATEKKISKDLQFFKDFVVKGFEISGNSLIIFGEIYGDEISITLPLSLKIRRISCPRCSMESGGYYEAIVQVRAHGRSLRKEEIKKIEEIVEKVLEEGTGEKEFLLKVEENVFGIDFYFGSQKIGEKVSRRIANELGGNIFRSKKLHTRIDGRDAYRFTFLIKLPEVEEYDVVLKDEKICVVKNARLQKGIDILTGKSVNIAKSNLITRKNSMRWGVITNLDEHIAEIMDSEGRIFHVIRPCGAEIGKEVFIFEFSQKTYAFPRDI